MTKHVPTTTDKVELSFANCAIAEKDIFKYSQTGMFSPLLCEATLREGAGMRGWLTGRYFQ